MGQVAVDKSAQGYGLGSILMHHVFEKTCVIAGEIGCYAILLDVMSDGGLEAFERHQSWYENFGFQSFASKKARMFMTIKEVQALTKR